MQVKTYYDTLEVPPNASQEQIHEAYRRMKTAYSSDNVALQTLISHQDCERELDEIEQAYSILSVPEKRREYNKVRGIQSDEEEIPSSDLSPEGHSPGHKRERLEKEFSINRRDNAETSKFSVTTRFSLNYEIDSEMENEIEHQVDFSGEFLKKVREYKGVDLPRMADMTKISKTHIQNLENEELGSLPASVYTRGFVYQYAKVLKLNPDLVANSYMSRLKNQTH